MANRIRQKRFALALKKKQATRVLFMIAIFILFGQNFLLIRKWNHWPPVMDLIEPRHSSSSSESESIQVSIPIKEEATITKGPVLSHVAIMGQFNFGGLSVSSILTWASSMHQAGFGRVLVRGPFDEAQVKQLRLFGVDASSSTYQDINLHNHSEGLPGYYTPYLHLQDALLDLQQNDPSIHGVLYIHDDAILNFDLLETTLKRNGYRTIIGTDRGCPPDLAEETTDPSYERLRGALSPRLQKMVETEVFRLYPGSTVGRYGSWNGRARSGNYTELFPDTIWEHRSKDFCMGGLERFVQNQYDQQASAGQSFSKSWDIDEETGERYWLIPSHAQADLLYVPTAMAETFAEIATPLYQAGVWLECAVPVLVDQLRHIHDLDVQKLPLCTSFDYGTNPMRGTDRMIRHCQRHYIQTTNATTNFGMYHPVKLGKDTSFWKITHQTVNGVWLNSKQTRSSF